MGLKPITTAAATKASHPRIALARCWALQRPIRAVRLLWVCMVRTLGSGPPPDHRAGALNRNPELGWVRRRMLALTGGLMAQSNPCEARWARRRAGAPQRSP